MLLDPSVHCPHLFILAHVRLSTANVKRNNGLFCLICSGFCSCENLAQSGSCSFMKSQAYRHQDRKTEAWSKNYFLFSTPSKDRASLGQTEVMSMVLPTFLCWRTLPTFAKPSPQDHVTRSLLCHVSTCTSHLSSSKPSGFVQDWVWLPKLSWLFQLPLMGKVQVSYLVTEGEATVKSTASGEDFLNSNSSALPYSLSNDSKLLNFSCLSL